jgi:DNA-binding transcriptional ArsR family regulator
VEVVFKALADPSRRELLDRLHQQNGQTLSQLCRDAPFTRQAVTKHLAILTKADLVIPLWKGREKLHYLNPAPLYRISERWLGKFEGARLNALRDLEAALEENQP